tara:strand:- start:36540 stop:37037 length:498 start_codon:yes stop_codon:yes gene_type:complete
MSATTSVLIKTAQGPVITSDKNNKNYRVVTFQEAGLVETPWGKLPIPSSQAKSTNIVCWEENINGKMDTGYGDPIFDKTAPQNGGWFQAALVARTVEAYQIPTGVAGEAPRTVDSATVLVYGNTADAGFEVSVRKAFKAKKLVLKNGSSSQEHAPVVHDSTAGRA